jgi:hypothetical protein
VPVGGRRRRGVSGARRGNLAGASCRRRLGEANECDGEVGNGLATTQCVRVCGGVRGRMSTVSTATDGARTRDRVRRVGAATAKLNVQRGGPGEACCGEATRGQGVSTGVRAATRAASREVLGARCAVVVDSVRGRGGARRG